MPQIEVTFDIDANGIVNVSAKDKATGKEQQIRIQASGGLSDDDIEKMVQDAEAHAEEDKSKKELIEARNNGSSLVHTTEKNLEEHGDKVSEEEKSEIQTALQNLKDCLESDDAEEISAKSEALMQASMKLGEAMYKDMQPESGMDETTAGGEQEADVDANSSEEENTVVDADFEEVEPSPKDKD